MADAMKYDPSSSGQGVLSDQWSQGARAFGLSILAYLASLLSLGVSLASRDPVAFSVSTGLLIAGVFLFMWSVTHD